MTRVGAVLLILAIADPAAGQQVPDPRYIPPVTAPEFADGNGPRVVIDAAHLNLHTAEGGYLAFARLLRRDGYVVRSSVESFTRRSLEDADVLVVVNARHPQSQSGFAPLPNYPAFTEDEVEAVDRWVRGGGSLLLIADHMPLAAHSSNLAAAFGVRFQNGFAIDSAGRGRVTFRRPDGSLPSTPFSDGRDPHERVDSVTTFTGQGFRLDPGLDAEPVLLLPPDVVLFLPQIAWEFSPSTARVPGGYLLQGALLRHGSGRVAVFGEAAMFTAQVSGPEGSPVGMNDPAAGQNAQFALNVMHWLSGRAR